MAEVNKLAMIKFLGDVVSNPAKFKEGVRVDRIKEFGDSVYVEAYFTGPLAEFLRGLNVKGSVEEKE